MSTLHLKLIAHSRDVACRLVMWELWHTELALSTKWPKRLGTDGTITSHTQICFLAYIVSLVERASFVSLRISN